MFYVLYCFNPSCWGRLLSRITGDCVTKGEVVFCFYRGSFARKTEGKFNPFLPLLATRLLLTVPWGHWYFICSFLLEIATTLSSFTSSQRQTMTLPSGYAAYVVWAFSNCVVSFLCFLLPCRQNKSQTNQLLYWKGGVALEQVTQSLGELHPQMVSRLGRQSCDWPDLVLATAWYYPSHELDQAPWGVLSNYHFYDWSIVCSHGLQNPGGLWSSVKEEFSCHLSQSSCVFCRSNMHACSCLAVRLLKQTCFYGFLFLN